MSQTQNLYSLYLYNLITLLDIEVYYSQHLEY